MITSQHFPNTKNDDVDGDNGNSNYPESIWCMHDIRRTFYYPNGTEVVVFTGTFSNDWTTNDYTELHYNRWTSN